MTIIERAAVAAPMVRKQTIDMPSLGGEVIARSLTLSELLTLAEVQRALREPIGSESDHQAAARAGAQMVSKTLALGIVLADDQPMWTESEWNLHGAAHVTEAMGLFNSVYALSGQDAQANLKN